MQLTKSLLVFALYMFGTQHVLAVPVNPEPDATSVENVALKTGSGDSQSDPIKADLEVKGQSALPFDVDCWAILCKGAPNVLNRDRSGANKGPFKDPQKWGIKALPPKNPSWSAQDFKSPEEYAFASSLQGGTNKPQQTKGTWFQITKFTGAAGPYCKALGSNDKSVCDKNKNIAGDWGFDPAKWAYQYDEKNNKFNYVGK
ncbi:unnamed protein product [Aspergillus oryzae RIB40]|uniref:DNA, SC111 n=1 Tax=Aspergillus oryzae (strain ATCC 42149 / RIB 40) TaxID=510516 RepID=Q2U877_ASPOR|nr:unnamed protein product [Aspergillus oryzae RIB40]BAE62238.1 unnamed protein product [Aspergillus oryzae RIB40]